MPQCRNDGAPLDNLPACVTNQVAAIAVLGAGGFLSALKLGLAAMIINSKGGYNLVVFIIKGVTAAGIGVNTPVILLHQIVKPGQRRFVTIQNDSRGGGGINDELFLCGGFRVGKGYCFRLVIERGKAGKNRSVAKRNVADEQSDFGLGLKDQFGTLLQGQVGISVGAAAQADIVDGHLDAGANNQLIIVDTNAEQVGHLHPMRLRILADKLDGCRVIKRSFLIQHGDIGEFHVVLEAYGYG